MRREKKQKQKQKQKQNKQKNLIAGRKNLIELEGSNSNLNLALKFSCHKVLILWLVVNFCLEYRVRVPFCPIY